MSQRAVLLSLPKYKPTSVDFNNISYSVSESSKRKEKKTVLKNLCGQFNSGELTAIMGPSGAGKSSLLHILTGFIKDGVEGRIKFTDAELPKRKTQFRKEICYIMQEDHLAPLFTVNEMMMISANLKLGQSLSYKGKQILVEDILDIMGLTKVGNTRCEKLSGGQRKRVSIALELVDNPPVMFLDEPTTGLDSVSSLQCAKVLKALARGGRTIVCTIHQPCASIMELIDHVYVLKSGECAYQGASYNILPYLRTLGLECPKYHNPADFIMEVVSGEHGTYHSQLVEAAKDNIWRKPEKITGSKMIHELECLAEKESDKTLVLIHPPSEFKRFLILFQCFYIQLNRDWTISHLKIFLHAVVGGLIGWMFIDAGYDASKSISNLSFIFASIVYLSYTTMMPGITRFPLEREIVSKEQFNNWYKVKTYFLAATFSSMPLQILFALVYISISYTISRQPMEWLRFGKVFMMCSLTTIGSESIGLFFGTLCRPVMGTFFGALFIAYLIVFGGFIILFPHIPKYLSWLCYTSIFCYAYDGMISSLYGDDRGKLYCPEDLIYCHLNNPKFLMKEMGISGDCFWFDVIAMIVIIIMIKIVTYFFLKRRVNTLERS